MSVTYAVPGPKVFCDTFDKLIELAKKCYKNKRPTSEFKRDAWLNKLTSIEYAAGGDYPDEESAEHALFHINNQLQNIKDIIKMLSPCDLNTCIKDLKEFKNKVNISDEDTCECGRGKYCSECGKTGCGLFMSVCEMEGYLNNLSLAPVYCRDCV